MRHSRPTLGALLGAVALAACQDDNVTVEQRPPLAGVRYVHAVTDTGRVDIRMVDQLAYSANTVDSAGGILYRQGTRYFPTEAKPRQIRVFSYQDAPAQSGQVVQRPIDVVSQVMLDTTITFEPNQNYTLLLVGSARAAVGSPNRLRFVRIDDTPPAADTTQIHTRVINANTGAPLDAYVVATGTTAIAGTPTFAGVANGAVANYVAFRAGTMALRVATAGSTTPFATVVADTGVAGTTGINPIAGSRRGGTAFSAFVFARAVEGSGALTFAGQNATSLAALRTTGMTLLVDRLPPNTVPTAP